jgi:hypothetical protein
VRTGTPVTCIEVTTSSVRVHFGPAGAGGQADYDYAVLASPPTVWPRIESVPAFRPGDYTMAHGPAVKFFSTFDNRFWESRGSAPSALWDRLGSVWEGTDMQRRTGGHALTVYSGGGVVLDPATYGDRMERLYPGYRTNLKRTAFADWRKERWVRTGYSVPAPGQVTTVARNLSRPFADRLLFAGEQASPGFFGYMEGALQAGLFAAYRIAAEAQIRCGRGEQAGMPAVALSELSGSAPDLFGYLDDLLFRQDLVTTEGAGVMALAAEAGPFSVEGELLMWATELAQAPRQVRESFGRRAEMQAVRVLVDSGARDEEWLTNLVFHARHRELGGRSIRPDEPRLAHEWQAIRDDEIQPCLAGDAMDPGAPPESAVVRTEGESPGGVFDVVRDVLATNAVHSALAGGERNENRLTDIGYRALPGGGAPIKAGDPRFAELSEQWIRIRDRIVRPLLRAPAPPAPAPAPPHKALAAQPVRPVADWRRRALQSAGIDPAKWNPDAGFKSNKRIVEQVYAYDMGLFNHNENLLWAGMAKLAGGQVYRGLTITQASIDAAAMTSDQVPSADVIIYYAFIVQVKLLIAQRAIFEDLAWQHQAIVEGGLPALVAASAAGVPVDAWRDIASGDHGRVRRGNRALLRREQEVVLAPFYASIRDIKDFDQIPEQMSANALSPIPGGKPFREVVPGGDITLFRDRWRWIETDMLPAYEQLTPGRRRQLVNTPLADLAAQRWPPG